MIVLKVDGIGNMIDVKGLKGVLNDAMERCTKGSDVWNTYDAVLTMVTSLSNDYDANLN